MPMVYLGMRLITTLLLLSTVVEAQPRVTKPALTLLIIVDQLPSQRLQRALSKMLAAGNAKRPGGFRYLIARGAYYPRAVFDVLHAVTAPGHATLLSGAYPAQHGIVLNSWYDRKARAVVLATEDARCQMIGASGICHSAHRLRAPTLGEAIKIADPQARLASVAIKHRAAVLMAGNLADRVFWLDVDTWRWVTSSAYRDLLPEYALALNRKLAAMRGQKLAWKARGVDRLLSIGTREALGTPYAAQMTADLALATLRGEALGKRGHPDLLTISFSSTDYAGHDYGAKAPEVLDTLLAVDRAISRILSAVSQQLGGLDRVLIVVSSDHGAAPKVRRVTGSGDQFQDHWRKRLEQGLSKSFGPDRYIAADSYFNYWLDDAALARHRIKRQLALKRAKELLIDQPGVRQVLTADDTASGKITSAVPASQVANGYLAGLSGDIVVIGKRYVVPGKNPGDHGTGYSYDTCVPLLIAGALIAPGQRLANARTIDIVPTISHILQITPPAMAHGRVLTEALRR
ncbi:MAG: alkaline phosphatase family protein [Deltaproteobacteria bacterium]|nr:alkaline phosphatase family protein [Deltaproteobacteria bacterium]